MPHSVSKCLNIIQIEIIFCNMHSSTIEQASGKDRQGSELMKAQQDGNHRNLKIPLIAKKPNTIQKYISKYFSAELTRPPSKHKHHRSDLRQSRHSSFQKINASNKLQSQDEDIPVLSDNQKYESTREENSVDKLEMLSKMEEDYVKLKYNVHPHERKQINDKKWLPLIKRKQPWRVEISPEQVSKEVKTAMIVDNGKQYYADLYLIKKGRDRVIEGLIHASIAGRDVESLTYEQKLAANQAQFVRNKIIKEREKKMNRMLKTRSLHWNVYYDMLALSKKEKEKVKQTCKFSQTYGII